MLGFGGADRSRFGGKINAAKGHVGGHALRHGGDDGGCAAKIIFNRFVLF
jgi:hypothetical protein